MTTFRPNDEVLAYVRRRARAVRRRRRLLAGGVGAAVVVVATVGAISLRSDPELASVAPPPEETTVASPTEPVTLPPPALGPPTPPAPLVEFLDPTSTGFTSTFVPVMGAAGPAGFVVVGGNVPRAPADPQPGQVWLSPDGRSWEPVADEIFSSLSVAGIAATENAYVLGAWDAATNERRLFVSSDGRSWQPVPAFEGTFDDVSNLRAAGGRFFRYRTDLAGFERNDPRQLLTSVDGVGWQPAVLADGTAFVGYAAIVHTGTEFIALGSGDSNGAIGLQSADGMLHSTDGITWTAGPPTTVDGLAEIAASQGTIVVATRAEPEPDDSCQLGATNADGSPVTTVAPSPCQYPTSFATLDPTTGSTVATSGHVFFTGEQSSFLTPWSGGMLAMSRDGTTGTVWASTDGLAWAGSESKLTLEEQRPLIAAGAGVAVVITDSQADGALPQVAIVTPG